MKMRCRIALYLCVCMVTSLFSGVVCLASGIGLSCDSNVAPFAIFEQSEGVNYKTNVSNGTYTVTDYYGNVVSSDNFYNKKIKIDGLPFGRFLLTVSDGTNVETSGFAVVPDVDERRDSSDSEFAFSAMASHTYSSEGVEEAYAKTIKLAGVPYVREFCRGEEIHDKVLSGSKRYRALLNEYAKNDINVLLMLQDFPGADSVTGEGLEDGHQLTRDMKNLYNNVVSLYRQHRGFFDAFEIENEIDVWAGACDGPDLYAAFLKTAAIAASESDADVLISTAGFTQENDSGYFEKLFSNGISEYFDIYDLHYYENADTTVNVIDYPADFSTYFPYAKENGITTKKLWLSEYGLRIPYDEGSTDLTEEQQRQQARTAPTAFIQAQAVGAEKVFWFIHGYVREAGGEDIYNGFGTMDQYHSPNMVYSAISALTNVLGNSDYKGEFDISNTNVKAHCYEEGQTQIGCFWAEQSENISIAVNDGEITLTDIMGNERELNITDGYVTLTAGPDIQYIRAENGFASDIVRETIKFDKDYKRSILTEAQKVVILPMFSDNAKSDAKLKGYTLSSTSGNRVTLKVYNFNNKSMSGTITATAPEGWNITANQQSVDIAPMGCTDLTFTVKKDGFTNMTNCLPLVFEGEFEGEKSSPAVSYIRTSLTFDNSYSTDLSLENVYYDGNSICAEFSGTAEKAKFLINGRTYDADIANNVATLELALNNGSYDVGISLFDKSHAVFYSTNTITVNNESDDELVIGYDANGGGATPKAHKVNIGEKTKLSEKIPYKRNSVFMGWSTDKLSNVAQFSQGETVSFTEDTVLYAVWEEGIQPPNVDFARYSSEKAIIKGFVDQEYGGENVTFVVFKDSATPDNLNSSDIVHIGETRIDYDGKYVIDFEVDGANGYRYVLNTGKEVVDSYMEEVTLVYYWMDHEITVRQQDDIIFVSAVSEKYVDDYVPVSLITAMYGLNGELLDVHLFDTNIEKGKSGIGGTYRIPAGTLEKKVFLWAADGTMFPLCEPQITN